MRILPLWVYVTVLAVGCTPSLMPVSVPPTSIATPSPETPLRIGMLAGHRGAGYGATCPDGVKEVDITTAIAARLQDKLQTAGYQVDVLDEFDARLEGYHAAVFVALHADSCIRDMSGFKVASRTMPDESGDTLQGCLQWSYRQATHLEPQPFGVTPAMTNYYAFDRLAPETPAAIIELGFISTDRPILIGQPDQAAQGVYDGLICFLKWPKP